MSLFNERLSCAQPFMFIISSAPHANPMQEHCYYPHCTERETEAFVASHLPSVTHPGRMDQGLSPEPAG